MSYPYQNYPQNPGAGMPQPDAMHLPYGLQPPSAAIGFSVPTAAPYPASSFMPSACPYPTGGYSASQQPYPTLPNSQPPFESYQNSFPNAPNIGSHTNAPNMGSYPNNQSMYGVPALSNCPPIASPNVSLPPIGTQNQRPYSPSMGSYHGMSNASPNYPNPQISHCPPTTPPYPNAYATNHVSKPPAQHISRDHSPSRPSLYPQVTESPAVQRSSIHVESAKTSHQPQHQMKNNPTIVPVADFNPRGDAEALRKAMKGLGTDEKAIIQVLAKKSNLQRLEIANQFKALFGKDLIKDLKGELSGRFEELVLACMTPLPQFYAKELKDAVSCVGTDEACLVEILATASNHYIQVISSTYKAMYGKNLENELIGDTSGSFRRLMVSLCQGRRDENPVINPGACSQDAQALYKAGEGRFGTDESTFNSILATRSFPHLQQVMVEYERLSGHSLEKAIKREFSGDVEAGLLAIVKSAANRPKFFAERLHNSMAGMGTKDRTLIRIIVTRSEVDLGDIKAEFHRSYGKSLEDFISGDTSGDYKKMLMAMVQ